MSAKIIARYTLLAFVVGSIAYVGLREVRGSTSPEPEPRNEKMVVYYFSEGKDCTTCENIPAVGKKVVDELFAEELSAGQVAWVEIDMDAPGNSHYATKYGLYTKSIVVASYEDGEEISAQNLKKVWDNVYDDNDLENYLREEIQAYWTSLQ